MRYQRYPEQVSLIQEGMVDLQTKHGDRFMILPESSVFNDYQLLFNLKSNIIYKSHSVDNSVSVHNTVQQ